MSANLDGLDNSIIVNSGHHTYFFKFLETLSYVSSYTMFCSLLVVLKNQLHTLRKPCFCPHWEFFGEIVESSGAVMGVALGLACSVPATRQTLERSWSTNRKAKKQICCVSRFWTKLWRYTSFGNLKSKEYDLESKDNKNDSIVLRLFARFHMADK